MRECFLKYDENNDKCARLCPRRARCKAKTAEAGLPKLKGIKRGREARWKKPEATPARPTATQMEKSVPKGTRKAHPEPPSIPKGTRKARASVARGTPRPMEMTVPYPIYSRNRYYRMGASGFYLDPGVKADKARVAVRVRKAGRKPMRGRLTLHLDLHAPDGRKRDLDNLLKSLQDGLKEGGAFEDDSQIDKVVLVRRRIIRPKGKVVVKIERYVEED